MAGTAVMDAEIAGEDLAMIAGFYNTYPYSLVVAPDIQTANDLRGKSLGISKPGTAIDSATRTALNILGLDPDKDVALLSIGVAAQSLAAMQAGRISGTVLAVPELNEAQKLGYRVLVDLPSLKIPYQFIGIATTRSYLKQNRQVAINFMKAIIEALALMKTDQEGTQAVLAKYLQLDTKEQAELLDQAYNVVVLGQIPKVPYPTLEGYRTILNDLSKTNPNATKFQPEDAVDLSIVQELEASGFIDNLYK